MMSSLRTGAFLAALFFLAFEIQAAIPLEIGTSYSGTIALPGETHTYTFPGTPGRRLYLDSLEADALQMNLTLISPAGAIVSQRNDDSDFGPFVLSETGNYSILLNGSGSTTGTYQFRILDLDAAPALTLGTILSGQLSPPLACNIYQFSGKRGQRINLQMVNSSSSAAQWQFVTPANVVLASGYIYQNLGVVTLPLDGPYCLIVNGYNQGTITTAPLLFQLLLTDVSDTPVTPSGFGTPHSGTINANQTNSFTYTAPAGLSVYFDSLDGSGQSLVVDLVDPSGTAVFVANETSDVGPYVLPRSGTYTVNVWGPSGASGNYNFRLLDLSASPALALNTLVSNVLNSPYETDVYQLPGTAGQRLYYDSLSYTFANVQFRLQGPDGQTPISVYQSYDAGPVTLPYTGTYYFYVQSLLPTTANYSFQLLDIAAQPLLPISSPFQGALDANAAHVYQLAGTNGERLFFNAVNVSAGGATWSLFDPKNAYVSGASVALGTDFAVTLPFTGNYVMVVANGPLSLTFSNLVTTFGFQTNGLAFGTPTTNAIANPGDQVFYTFTGTNGHRMYFDALWPTYSAIYLNIISPRGQTVAYNNASYDFGPFTLLETGTYTVIFYGSLDTTGPIGFQLLDIDTQPALPLNVDFTGTLDPNSSRAFQLSWTNHEHLYFNGKNPGSGPANWSLFDQRNTQVGTASLDSDFTPAVPASSSGTYALILSDGPNVVTYSNQINTFSLVTNSLTLGAAVSNNIFNPGDQVFYSFTGTPGQRVYYDSLFPNYVSVTATLLSPSGLNVFSANASSDIGPATLLESGTYTLVFSASQDIVTGIAFELLDIGAQPALPLNTDLTGTLASNTSRIYQLTGIPGEQLYFDSKGAYAGSASWFLYGPNNVQAGSSYLGGDFEVTLSYAGTYVLVFTAGALDVTYSNQVSTFSFNTNALTLGTPIINGILKPGNQLYYTFNGTAGQRLYYDSRQTNYLNAYLYLLSPGGQNITLGNPSYDKGPFTLTQSGTYTLLFDALGDSTGVVAFNLLDLSAAAPISLGNTITDSLSDQTQTRLYRFSGVAGQRVNPQSLTSPTTAAVWTLLGLADQSLGPVPYISGNIGPVTLPANGIYTIAIIGNTTDPSPLPYQFSVSDVSDSSVVTTGLGQLISGTIGANQTNTFTFTAPAGLPVFFDSQDTSGQNLNVDLISPDNTLFARLGETSDAGPYALPRSGTYTVSVWGNNGASGNYSFRLLDLSTSPLLPLNTPISATLTNSYQTDFYQFATTPGQQLIYNALTNDPNNPSVYVQLLDPRGQTVGPNSDFANSSAAPFTMQYGGTAYLLFRNLRSTANGYSFQMLDLAAQPALPLNTSVTNVLGTYALTVYKYSGSPGQQLFFGGSPNNPSGYWSLYDPNNVNVYYAGGNLAGNFEVTIPANGMFTLMLQNTSGNPATNVFQVNNYLYFTNSYALGTTVVDAITRPGERRVYTFTGTVGQVLYYDALTNGLPYPNIIDATLLNPAGVADTPVGGDFSVDRGPFTLQHSGTYSLVMDGVGGAVGPIAFRLLDIAAQPTLPLNTIVTNTLDPYPSLIYRYSGTTGQRLYFRGQPNNLGGYWTLYTPNNVAYLSYANLTGDFEGTLPMNGTYTLVLYTYNTLSGPEVFQVNDFNYFTNSYAIGSTIMDSINRPGERRFYTFNGTVGQRLIYDALTNGLAGPYSISATLLNPQGIDEGLISGDFSGDRGPFALRQTGQYTLVIDGNVSAVGTFAFRLLDLLQQPDLPLNVLVTNTIDLYPTVIYKYSGSIGQQLYFRGQIFNNPPGYWYLYDPNNAYVSQGGSSLYGDFQVTLPANGIYCLKLDDNGYTPGTNIFEVNPFNFGEPLQINRAPVLSFIPDQITGEGGPMFFTAHATDPDANTLVYSLDPGGPGGASIDSATGLFSWTPPPSGFSYITNVTVRVTDTGLPPLSVAQRLSISVIAGPVMLSVHKTTTDATIFWRTALGRHYQLSYKNSLLDPNWTLLGGVLAATDYVSSEVDNTIGNHGTRYYRVQLLDPSP